MSKFLNDINDDEIRIISGDSEKSSLPSECDDNDALEPTFESKNSPPRKSSVKFWVWVLVIVCIVLVLLLCLVVTSTSYAPPRMMHDEEYQSFSENRSMMATETKSHESVPMVSQGYVAIIDTIAGGEPLTVLFPRDLTPRLCLGEEALDSVGAMLLLQAADIRADNGGIVGAFVYDGELVSRGQSKAGFCAIINGKIVLGIADSTPYLEQAIETGGFFFRQYPLVVGGQVVENKLKSSSLRRALAEIDGQIAVALSRKKMTLNEFSQTLVDLGVTNAIYLVGSTAYGYVASENGTRMEFGVRPANPTPSSNYIVWE